MKCMAATTQNPKQAGTTNKTLTIFYNKSKLRTNFYKTPMTLKFSDRSNDYYSYLLNVVVFGYVDKKYAINYNCLIF